MTKTDICNLALVKIGEKTISTIDDPNDKNARHAKLHYAQARDEILRAGFWSFAMDVAPLEPEVALASYVRVLDDTTAAALEIEASFAESGTNDGKAAFDNEDADEVYWDSADVDYGAAWIIEVGGTAKFYSNEDVAMPELVETWTAVNGASGTPSFTTLLDDQIDGRGSAFALPADFLKLRKVTSNCGKVDKFAVVRANGKRCIVADADRIRLHYVASNDTPGDYDPSFTAGLVTLLASKLARAISGSDELETTLMQRYEKIDLPKARTDDGHDSQSDENHPLQDLLDGDLLGRRGAGDVWGE